MKGNLPVPSHRDAASRDSVAGTPQDWRPGKRRCSLSRGSDY